MPETGLILNKLEKGCQPFKTWRDKKLAHFDFPTSMNISSNPLPDVSVEMIEDALALVREHMDLVEPHCYGADVGYEHFFMHLDGEALIAVLRDGMRYEELW